MEAHWQSKNRAFSASAVLSRTTSLDRCCPGHRVANTCHALPTLQVCSCSCLTDAYKAALFNPRAACRIDSMPGLRGLRMEHTAIATWLFANIDTKTHGKLVIDVLVHAWDPEAHLAASSLSFEKSLQETLAAQQSFVARWQLPAWHTDLIHPRWPGVGVCRRATCLL